MSKKKTSAARDRHKSTFVIRLPEEYRSLMQELKKKTRRPITAETQMALDTHLKANGIELPQSG